MKKSLLIIFLLNYAASVAQNPIAHYTFSGNANDITGNGNNGAVNGATLTTDRFGNANSAYSFDGVNDNIDLGTGTQPASELSYIVWFRTTTTNTPILNGGIPTASVVTGYALFVQVDGKVVSDLETNGTGGWDLQINSNSAVNDGEWHQAAFTYDGANANIYIDGVLQTETAAASGNISYDGSTTLLGSFTNSHFFNGEIDDIRVYDQGLTASQITELFLNESVVASYTFSGNANDQSGNGNNGTVSGATLTTDRFGNANSAYSFDGVDDIVNLGPVSTFDQSYSISLWVKRDGTGREDWVLGKGSVASTNQSLHLGFRSNDNFIFAFWGNDLDTEPFTDNDWHHWTCVYDATSSGTDRRIYLDGQLVASDNAAGSFSGTGDVILGNTPTVSAFFDGSLDELKFYERALSASEVSSIFTSESPLLASYTFSGDATDQSGNGNDGTVSGAVLTTDRFGNANSAYNFDGSNDYITSASVDFSTYAIGTYNFWVNPNSISEQDVLMNYYTNDANRLTIDIGTGNTIQVTARSADVQEINWNTGVGLTLNTWQMISLSQDNSILRLYVDGVQQASTTDDFWWDGIGDSDLFIGATGSGANISFSGKIDDVSIYGKTLDATEISNLYSPGSLVAHHTFSGDALDQSGNGNDGSVSGATLTTDRFANADEAYSFDGLDDWISFGDNFEGYSEATFSVWFKPDDIDVHHLVAKSNSSVELERYTTLIYSDGQVEINMASGTDTRLTASTTDHSALEVGKWYHFVFTFDGSQAQTSKYQIYVDGDQKNLNYTSTNFDPSSLPSNSQDFHLGRIVNSLAENVLAEGSFDDLRIYDRVLSAGEITSLFDQENHGPTVYYPFSGDANDQSGNSFHGGVTNATLTADRFGNSNGAYFFDGTSTIAINTGTGIQLNDDFTYNLWINPTSYPAGELALVFDPGSTFVDFVFQNSGILEADPYTSDPVATTDVIPLDSWTMVTASRSGNTLSIYINGMLSASGSTTSTGNLFPRDIGSTFHGNIDDVRIYNRALSTTEISNLYTIDDWPILSVEITGTALTGASNSDVVSLRRANDSFYLSRYLYDGTLRFQANGDASINWGDDELDGVGDQDGADIPVTEGLYAIKLEPSDNTYFITEITTVGFIGSARTGDAMGWDSPDTDMQPVGLGAFQLNDLRLFDGDWKIRANDTETLMDWGGPGDGTFDLFGADIPVSAGTYNLTVSTGISLNYSLTNVELVADYPFNGDAVDESTNSNDGTVVGATQTTDRFGDTNSAFSFDGADDRITIPFTSQSLGNEMTISAWVYRDKSNGSNVNQGIVSNDENLGSRGVLFGIIGGTGNDAINASFTNDLGSRFTVQGNEVPEATWKHYAMSYNGSTLRIYEDGVEVNSVSASGDIGGTNTFVIGHDPFDGAAGRYFGGKLDDIRFYSRALSSTEVSNLYRDNEWLAPRVTGVFPRSGAVGETVRVYGDNLAESGTIISFGSTDVSPTSSLDNVLVFDVPDVSTGNQTFSVRNDFGNSNGESFAILAAKTGTLSFENEQSLSAAIPAPYDIHLADFNKDNYPDLLTYSFDDGDLLIFHNDQSGAFPTSIRLIDGPSGQSQISTIESADIDADGNLDILMFDASDIHWFRNMGNGVGSEAYSSENTVATGSNFRDLAVGDMDGDGFVDVVAVENGVVQWYKNDGSGSFGSAQIMSSTPAAFRISLNDIDNDGDLDLLQAHNSNFFLRNDNGTFAQVFLTTPTNGSDAIITGDFDEDNFIDVAFGSFNDHNVDVYLNNQAAAFNTATDVNSSETHLSPEDFSIGDMDGDGDLDFLTAFFNGGGITVLYDNDGTGSFSATEVTTGQTSLSRVEATDLDNDGDLDVVFSRQDGNIRWIQNANSIAPVNKVSITSFSPTSGPIGTSVTISGSNFDETPANNVVYFGATQATVSSATSTELTVTVPSGATYKPITVLVNGLVASSSNPFAVTHEGAGIAVNSFDSKVNLTTGTNPYYISIGDLDGDGKTDVAVPNFTSNTISIFRNTSVNGAVSAGSFSPKVDFVADDGPTAVSIGDLDGDGKLDLAVANWLGNTVSIIRNTSQGGILSSDARVDLTTGTNPFSVAIGDLDDDGKPDLAVANRNSNTVSIFRNTSVSGTLSTGSFSSKVDFATGTNPLSVAIGDLDGDGKADLAVTNFGSGTVSLFRNTSLSGSLSASSFSPKVDLTTGTEPYSVSIGDLDGDSKADLVVANRGSSSVSVFRNTSSSGALSTNSFSSRIDFTTGAEPWSVSIGDLDGDGKSELVSANEASNSLSVFKNLSVSGSLSTDSFRSKVDYAAGEDPRSVSIGDLDGDGKADLVVSNYEGNSITAFRNGIVAAQPSTFTNNTPSQYLIGDGGLSLSATVLDANGISSVNVFYKKVSSDSYIQATMNSGDGNAYTFTIDDSDIDNIGLQYYFQAVDVNSDLTRSDNFLTSTVVADDGETIPSLTAGTNIQAYRIVAFPYESFSANQLIDDLGDYNTSNWRLVRYSGGGYQDLNEFNTISAGVGYWFIMREQTTVTVGGQSVEVDDNRIFRINLTSGYNLIGNPFKGTLNWRQVVDHNVEEGVIQSGDIASGNSNTLDGWNTAWTDRTSLSPFEGGFVNMVNAVSNFEIPISALNGSGGREASFLRTPQDAYIDEEQWEMRFFFATPSYTYSMGGIGMHPNASDGDGPYDKALLPKFLLYLDQEFEDGNTRSIKETDFYKKWSFKLPNNLEEKFIHLTWDAPISSNKTVILVDGASRKLYNLKNTQSINLPNNPEATHYLYYGNEETIYRQMDLSFTVFAQVYPNPVQGELTLRMYSPEEKTISLELISLDGKKALSEFVHLHRGMSEPKINLDEKSIENGLYFIKIENEVLTKILKK